MKVTAISDLHGNLIDIEPCDLLLICGDISPLKIQRDYIQMTKWIFNEFYEWIRSIPCNYIVFTPGNHDFWFYQFVRTDEMELWNKLIILIDGETRIYSDTDDKYYTIYGTPQCKTFGMWPYMPGEYVIQEKYKNIPYDLDILICHDAPDLGEIGYIHYDEPLDNGKSKIPAHNYTLGKEIRKKNPKYILCGHIHSGDHELKEIEGIKCANVSILDESYNLCYKPLTFEI